MHVHGEGSPPTAGGVQLGGFAQAVSANPIAQSAVPVSFRKSETLPSCRNDADSGVVHAVLMQGAADAASGLRRARTGARMAAIAVLRHPGSAGLSNSQIARELGVPETTLRRWRRALARQGRSLTSGESTYAPATGDNAPGQGRTPGKLHGSLCRQVAEMKGRASPTARRLLNVIEHWLFGHSTPAECLNALERFVGNCQVPVTDRDGEHREAKGKA